MFTSDRKKAVEYAYKLFNYACICLTAAVFCALFGAVYEVFSHGVFSFYMIYAFAIPLCLGTFPLMIILLCAGRKTEKLEIIDLKEAETLYEEDRYWENSCLYLFPGRGQVLGEQLPLSFPGKYGSECMVFRNRGADSGLSVSGSP